MKRNWSYKCSTRLDRHFPVDYPNYISHLLPHFVNRIFHLHLTHKTLSCSKTKVRHIQEALNHYKSFVLPSRNKRRICNSHVVIKNRGGVLFVSCRYRLNRSKGKSNSSQRRIKALKFLIRNRFTWSFALVRVQSEFRFAVGLRFGSR